MRGLLLLVAVAGCAFKGAGNPGDDSGDDSGDDQGDDTAVIDAGPGDPDAAPELPDADPPDPVTATFGERPTSDHGGTLDTYLDSTVPTTVLVTAFKLVADGGDDQSTGIVRFDLTPIPPGSSITAAALEVYTITNGGGDEMELFVVNQPWDADATWEDSGLGPWLTPGAGPPSRAKTVVGSLDPSAGSTAYTIAITPAVIEAWVDDAESNLGFALVVVGEDGVELRSSNTSPSTVRPELTVTYVPPAL